MLSFVAAMRAARGDADAIETYIFFFTAVRVRAPRAHDIREAR
jgi:hypothetical protein